MSMSSTPPSFWSPQVHADRRPFLIQRTRIRRALEGWFDREGFLSVECGQLQVSPGNETHLHAFATRFAEPGNPAGPALTLYLHTSPEFSCKKLLAAGESRIVDFARVFRNGESGPLHAPEFTMVEWYRTHVGLPAVMADAHQLCMVALAAAGRTALSWRGKTCDPTQPPEALTLSQAFARYAGLHLDSLLGQRDAFARACEGIGLQVRADDNWSDLFSRVVVARIEPRLGEGRLTCLHRYPLCEAALAKPCADDPRFADRFELYACGVELANGFAELTDPAEQRARFEADMDEKERLYGERYPLDEDFLAALAHMPPACGVALGLDRLVMLATGARHIRDVLWTPPVPEGM
jgi:lysyl-tRNA synthetase class 2